MTAKLLLAAGTYLVGAHLYKILSLTQDEIVEQKVAASIKVAQTLAGKVVKSQSSETLYFIRKPATRIEYVSYQAYLNDGKREIVTLPDEQVKWMPLLTNGKIYETGYLHNYE